MDKKFVQVSMASAVPHLQEINDHLAKDDKETDPQHMKDHLNAVKAIVDSVVAHVSQDIPGVVGKAETAAGKVFGSVEGAVLNVVHSIHPSVYGIIAGVACAASVVWAYFHYMVK